MIYNRIKWFLKLIKTRGIRSAFSKLGRELYQKKKWVVLKLPTNTSPTKIAIEESAQTLKMNIGDHDIFAQLAIIWPSDFPAYNKIALCQEFESRIDENTTGYYLQENDQAIGAMWLSNNEGNLKTTSCSLGKEDKIVKNLFISPSEHGRSLAKQLVYKSILDARSRNTKNIYALVYPERVASIKTFLALGFHQAGLLNSTTFLFKTKLNLHINED